MRVPASVQTLSRRMMISAAVVLGLALVAVGCNFSKTGAVAADAPDQVTVLPAVGGAATSVILDPGTAGALASLGIDVRPTGSARQSGSTVSFPITAGYLEVHSKRSARPGWIDGSLSHQGSGLALSSAGPLGVNPAMVTLSDFVVDPGNSMLYATVNGKVGVPLLSLDGSKVTERVELANQITLNGTVAKLTATGATALNGAFSTSTFTAGTPLGTVEVLATGQPSIYDANEDHVTALSRLTGTSTTLTIDPSVVAALQSLGVGLAPTGTASVPGPGAVQFPITAGFAAIHSNRGFSPGYVVGSILHQGSGIALSTAPGPATRRVALSDFVVDPGDSVLSATLAGKPRFPLFYLDGAKLAVTPTANGVTLDGTVARLTDTSAKALDEVFATAVFAPGMAIGTVHLVATGS